MEKQPRSRKLTKRQIACIVIAAVLVAGAITVTALYFALFFIPPTTPAERVSQGIVPTAADLARAKVYDRVVIFGVDGAGGAFADVDTPYFDEIFGEGSINYDGMAQYPTISAPNWAAMLLGVTAQTHKITNAKAKLFANDAYPSIFGLCAQARTGATFFSCCNWDPINRGIIEDGVPGLTKVSGKSLVKGDSFAVDRAVAQAVVDRLSVADDSIVLTHFDSVDHAGHHYGNRSEQYKTAIERTDECLGLVYEGYKAQNKLEGTLFILVTDHGHTVKGGHGKESGSEKQTTLAVAGSLGDIIKGSSGAYVTHDLASIVLYALGIPQPAHFEGGVPTNLFGTLQGE